MIIREILFQAADRFPNRDALVVGDTRLTYSELYWDVLKLAKWLVDKGVEPGDRLCLGMRNSVEHVTTFLACQVLGVTAVPFNIRLKPPTISHILNDSEARGIVVDGSVDLEPLQRYVPNSPSLLWIDAEKAPRGHSLAYWDHQDSPPLESLPGVDAATLSAIIYTSGTTGLPKGVALSNSATYGRLVTYIMSLGPAFDSGTRTLGAAPLYHTVGMHWVLLQTLFVNGTYFPVRKISEETVNLVRRQEITFIVGSPTMYKMMIDTAGGRPLTSVHNITFGSAPVEPELIAEMQQFFPNASISEFYGSTELSMPFVTRSVREANPGALRVAGDFRVSLIKHGGGPGDLVKAGELGELLVHLGNKGIFDTYVGPNGAVLKEEKCSADWFHTGDGMVRDDAGNFYFVGRLDDMFISGGENIQPVEVENVINSIEGVRDCAVVGAPDPLWGNLVTAFVVRSGAGPDRETIDKHFRSSNLEDFKRPREVYFTRSIPRNPSGKILRHEVSEQLLAGVRDGVGAHEEKGLNVSR